MNNYIGERIDVRVHSDPFEMGRKIDVLLIHRRTEWNNEHFAYGQPVVFQQVSVDNMAGVTRPEPTFSLYPDDAQQMMDALWRCGIRPTEGAGSAGQMAATQKHLEDMRTLVFKTHAQS